MSILVDTCVWSMALRRGPDAQGAVADELRRLVASQSVRIIGPIRQEILSGVRDAGNFQRLDAHLRAFPDIALITDDFVTAARFYNTCRTHGVQGANTDFLICSVAARLGLAVFTTDQDFTLYARYLPVTLHPLREGAWPRLEPPMDTYAGG